MLYFYPDNYIVPVIFVENFLDKKICKDTYDRYLDHEFEEMKDKDGQCNYNSNYYVELKKRVETDLDNKEDLQEIDYIDILIDIDKEYADSETGI